MKTIKSIKITNAQLTAIVTLTDSMSAMVGSGNESFDKETSRAIKLVDTMLKNNGLKRKHN